MKKIFLAVAVFLFLISSCKGYSIKIDSIEGSITKEYIPNKSGSKYYYEISPFSEYEVANASMINTLASLNGSINGEPDLYQAIIQMLIWRNVHPNCRFHILKNNVLYDTTSDEESILRLANQYNRANLADGLSYEINVFEPLLIVSEDGFNNYQANYPVKITYNSVEFLFDKPGDYEVEFKSTINIKNNIILSNTLSLKDFKVYIKVLGKEIIINPTNKENYNLIFDIYDKYNNNISQATINKNNNKISIPEGKDIILKERSNLVDDIYIPSDILGDFKIDVEIIDKLHDIYLITYLSEYPKNNCGNLVEASLTIKNLNGDVVERCKDSVCQLKLKEGIYLIENDITKQQTYLNVPKTTKLDLYEYYIEGIISNEEILSIKSNGEEISFKKDNDFYGGVLLKPDIYEIEFKDKTVSLDLRDFNKLSYIDSFGLVYVYNDKKDEVIKEDVSVDQNKPNDNDKNENKDNENNGNEFLDNEVSEEKNDKEDLYEEEILDDTWIEVSIPNTEIEVYIIKDIYVKKKYKDIYSNHSFFTL